MINRRIYYCKNSTSFPFHYSVNTNRYRSTHPTLSTYAEPISKQRLPNTAHKLRGCVLGAQCCIYSSKLVSNIGMNAQELRAKTSGELNKLLTETRAELQQLRFDIAQGRVKNIRELRKKKRTIAQIMTMLSQQKEA